MNRLTEKQLLVLTIGITVLLGGGLGFLIWTDMQSIKEERKATEELRVQIDAAQREIDQIPSREYRVIANREISDREVSFLPSETEIENFWDVLERFAEESGVRISAISSSGGGGHRRGRRSTIDSVPQILNLTATTEEFLRFMNLMENYDRIINVVDYRIGAGKGASEDGKVRQSIQLSLTTFTYSKKVANTIVSIANYDKKKEHPEVKKWLSRIKIQERESYTLRPSAGRRDPFENLRRIVDPGVAGPEVDLTAQEAVLETLVEDVRSLQEGLEIESHLRKIGDLFRLTQQMRDNRESFLRINKRIDDVRRNKMIQAKELVDRFRTEVVAVFATIAEQMDNGPQESPVLTAVQIKEWRARVAKYFDEHEWKKVQSEVKDFMDVSKEGKHVEDAARAMAMEIIDFDHRSKVIQEFEKRRVKISTIVYSPNAMSFAVINGKLIGEGDALDPEGKVLLVEVGENYVIFETEGVDIKRTQK